MRRSLAIAAVTLLFSGSAYADASQTAYTPASYGTTNGQGYYPANQSTTSSPSQTTKSYGTQNTVAPDLLSFGAGSVDFDKDNPRSKSAEFRLEYRTGFSLWSAQNNWLDFGIHPLVGGQVSTRGQLYGFGGFGFDIVLYRHYVITESEAVGLFDGGTARPLGSIIEFRSQLEAGYRFDNNIRLTAEISHLSNAGITKQNPGEEIIGGYVHVPLAMAFGAMR